MDTHEKFFHEAARVALKSFCLRDKCGSIIVANDVIIGSGYNAPPQDDLSSRKCHLDLLTSPKPKSDRTCCVHAEWRALMDAMKNPDAVNGATLYFTRVDDQGTILPSGVPYCTVCSRLALDAGIRTWVLWHETGIQEYDAKEYNDLSYQFHQSDLGK